MEKKEVVIGNPVSVTGATLIPVVEVSISYRRSRRRISATGNAQPTSIVIISPTVRKAFRITGEEVSLDQLGREVPAIRKLMSES